MQCHKGGRPGSFSHPNPWQHHQQSGLAAAGPRGTEFREMALGLSPFY